MVAVALLALALAVIVQSVRLHEAHIRERQLRAEAELERDDAMQARDRARAVEAEYYQRLVSARAQAATGTACCAKAVIGEDRRDGTDIPAMILRRVQFTVRALQPSWWRSPPC